MDEGKVLIHFLADVSLLERIDNLRWKQRDPSRAETIRRLLESALSSAERTE